MLAQNLHRLAVGAQPPLPVRVPLQTHLVEQFVRPVHIVLGEVAAHPVLGAGPLGPHRRGERPGLTVEQRLADVVPVDRQRQRLPESNVIEDLRQDGILVGVVEPPGRNADGTSGVISSMTQGPRPRKLALVAWARC